MTGPNPLPDIPGEGAEFADYASLCRRLDDTVGKTLEALEEEAGIADNMVVMFVAYG